MQNLEELKVEECNSLKYLFSSAIARSLVRLKKLRVFGCETMEGVIVTEESRDCIEFSSLSSLNITNCPELKVFISKSMATMTSADNDKQPEEMELVPKQSLFKDKVIFLDVLNHFHQFDKSHFFLLWFQVSALQF